MFSICLFLVTWPLPDLFRLPFKGRREAGGEEEERREREREKKILLVKIIPLSSKVGTLSPVPGSQGSHVRCVCVCGGVSGITADKWGGQSQGITAGLTGWVCFPWKQLFWACSGLNLSASCSQGLPGKAIPETWGPGVLHLSPQRGCHGNTPLGSRIPDPSWSVIQTTWRV
jgi:hypothetical protein